MNQKLRLMTRKRKKESEMSRVKCRRQHVETQDSVEKRSDKMTRTLASHEVAKCNQIKTQGH